MEERKKAREEAGTSDDDDDEDDDYEDLYKLQELSSSELSPELTASEYRVFVDVSFRVRVHCRTSDLRGP